MADDNKRDYSVEAMLVVAAILALVLGLWIHAQNKNCVDDYGRKTECSSGASDDFEGVPYHG